jgi:hypothetical protein
MNNNVEKLTRIMTSLDAFSHVPSTVGTLAGVFSADGEWLLFRHGIVAGRMARWDEEYAETGLFVAYWPEFERLAEENKGKPFDSWAPSCCNALLASNCGPAQGGESSGPGKPR